MNFVSSSIIRRAALVAGATTLLATGASAQFISTTSGSIDGSLCVGFDCLSSEAFGFDTIRMKENNLRLHFDDTSTTSSFPPNDWRLYANDSSNGGSSYFGVEDATAGRFVFRVFAGARSNALTVDSQGDVGLGTTTPALDIDIKTGDTPSLRFQQDGTSGFAPQSWDVAGNEAGFFIRDATAGSTLPFRILTGGAPSQSLVIAGDGAVGMGAGTSPDARLHVRRTTASNSDMMLLENNGATVIRLEDTSAGGQEWTFQSNGGTFRVASPANPGPELTLDDDGNLTITGELTTSGSCSIGCDRVFDKDYELRTLEEHMTYMWENKHLPNVGPTAEEGPINLSQKMGGFLNELEHAHIYIDQLHQRDELRAAEIAELRALVTSYEDRVKQLEAR